MLVNQALARSWFRMVKRFKYAKIPDPTRTWRKVRLIHCRTGSLEKQFMDVALTQNMPYYRQTLLVEVDGPNGKLRIQDEPVLVTQLYQTEITSYVVGGQT